MQSKTRKEKLLRKASGIAGVFQQNESLLKRFLRRFTSSRQDVEDICQETVLRAIEAEKIKEIQEPRAFLFGIARNIVRKELDKKSRNLIDFVGDFTPEEYALEGTSLEDHFDARQKMILFGQAVTTLPSQCQKVFLMKKVYGYSHKEIAKHLDISISTVEKHVATGLKRCNDYMARQLGGAQVSHVEQDLAEKEVKG